MEINKTLPLIEIQAQQQILDVLCAVAIYTFLVRHQACLERMRQEIEGKLLKIGYHCVVFSD